MPTDNAGNYVLLSFQHYSLTRGLELKKPSFQHNSLTREFGLLGLHRRPIIDFIYLFKAPDKVNLVLRSMFLTYETQFVLFLAVLENSVFPMD